MHDEEGPMERLIDVCDGRADTDPWGSEALTAELASCLDRFLEGTADEGTMSRSRWAVDTWRRLQLQPGPSRLGFGTGGLQVTVGSR